MVKKLLGNYFKRYTPPLAAAGIKGMRIQLGFGSALGFALNNLFNFRYFDLVTAQSRNLVK